MSVSPHLHGPADKVRFPDDSKAIVPESELIVLKVDYMRLLDVGGLIAFTLLAKIVAIWLSNERGSLRLERSVNLQPENILIGQSEPIAMLGPPNAGEDGILEELEQLAESCSDHKPSAGWLTLLGWEQM